MKFLLLIPIFLIFISCEPQTDAGSDKDTVVVVQEEKEVQEKRNEEEISEQRKSINNRLDSLEKRVELATEDARQETREAIERLKQRRDSILSDTTSAKLEQEWERFERDLNAALDSLEKKIE